MNQLIHLAAKYFKEYQTLTGQGMIFEAGGKLDSAGQILDKLIKE
jgi:hypothetical protein